MLVLNASHLAWTNCLHSAPKQIYFKGDQGLILNEPKVAIVGSRCMTNYGKQVIETIIPGLVRSGITIVSGGAFGIDLYAQKTALNYDGKVITVLGSGINNAVPRTNHEFFKEVEQKGLIISEYPGQHPATRYTFPERNRLISALSDLVLLIEAREKSGSLITANFGIEQGKVVAAFPGRSTDALSKGTNNLIKHGAHMVSNTRDILELLPHNKTKDSDPIQQTLSEIYN